MNTSFSALETFRTCPLKYKYQEIDKLSTPKGPEAVFGTLIHSSLKMAHDGGFLLPSKEEVLGHFAKNWNSEIFKDEIMERAAFAQGVNIIQNYYQKNKPENAKIVALESRFTIELADEKTKENHLVSGFIDRIDKTDDGYEIIDYKTSKKLPSQKHADESLQLLIYLLAIIKRYPELEKTPEKVKLSLYFLKHGAKLSTGKTIAQMKKEKEMVLDLIKEIQESKFGPKVGPLCNWCGHQKICPMWGHKFKDKEKTGEKEKQEVIEEYLELVEKSKRERKRISELTDKMLEIMEEEGDDRLFGQGKIIAKIKRQTFEYDENALKEILHEKGLWGKVLRVNKSDLKKVMEILPLEERKNIEKTRKVAKESWGLSVKKEK